jgi:hypothetical protein
MTTPASPHHAPEFAVTTPAEDTADPMSTTSGPGDDPRYSVAHEVTHDPAKRWVARFNGQWITCAATKAEAWRAATLFYRRRVAVLSTFDGLPTTHSEGRSAVLMAAMNRGVTPFATTPPYPTVILDSRYAGDEKPWKSLTQPVTRHTCEQVTILRSRPGLTPVHSVPFATGERDQPPVMLAGVALIDGYPRDTQGRCAFCLGDPTAHNSPRDSHIALYVARSGAGSCPCCPSAAQGTAT